MNALPKLTETELIKIADELLANGMKPTGARLLLALLRGDQPLTDQIRRDATPWLLTFCNNPTTLAGKHICKLFGFEAGKTTPPVNWIDPAKPSKH